MKDTLHPERYVEVEELATLGALEAIPRPAACEARRVLLLQTYS